MKNFDQYAQYYNLLYQNKDYKNEAEYVNSLLTQHGNKKIENILDLGCGTGRHDYVFAQSGYNVTGVDLSENMLLMAKQNAAHPRCTYIQGDVRNVVINKIFDVVISLFHVASYQTSNNDVMQFFQTAHQHLCSDGLFVFDYWYGAGVLTDLPQYRIKNFENETHLLTRTSHPTIFWHKNVVEVHFNIALTDKTTGSVSRFNEYHPMRYFFLPEIALMLQQSGFEIINHFEWLTDKPLQNNVWYGVTVAKAIKNSF